MKFRRNRGLPEEVRQAITRDVWCYSPSLHWYGWKTLLPFLIGHDEWARRTLVLGWTITGRIVIALGVCNYIDEDDPELSCVAQAIEHARFMKELDNE